MATVAGQNMTSAEDRQLIGACKAEKRCLVTLDLDFSNPLLFPPWEYSGIAVFRLPAKMNDQALLAACQTLVSGLARSPITGKRWIVQRGRIREYQPERSEGN